MKTEEELELENHDYNLFGLPMFPVVSITGQNVAEQYSRATEEMFWGKRSGWHCQFCNRWVDPLAREKSDFKARPDDELTPLELFFKQYEEIKAPLDSSDKELLRKMFEDGTANPDLCPFCFRREKKDWRLAVVLEIIAYWVFLVMMYIPLTLIAIGPYCFSIFIDSVSQPYADMVTAGLNDGDEGFLGSYCPCLVEALGLSIGADTDVELPNEAQLHAEFKADEKYRGLFDPDDGIWDYVQRSMGVKITMPYEDRNGLLVNKGEDIRSPDGRIMFEVNGFCRVIYVDTHLHALNDDWNDMKPGESRIVEVSCPKDPDERYHKIEVKLGDQASLDLAREVLQNKWVMDKSKLDPKDEWGGRRWGTEKNPITITTNAGVEARENKKTRAAVSATNTDQVEAITQQLCGLLDGWEASEKCPRCDKEGIQATWEYCPECSFHIKTGDLEKEQNAKWREFFDNRKMNGPNLAEAESYAEMAAAMKDIFKSTLNHFEQKLAAAQEIPEQKEDEDKSPVRI